MPQAIKDPIATFANVFMIELPSGLAHPTVECASRLNIGIEAERDL